MEILPWLCKTHAVDGTKVGILMYCEVSIPLTNNFLCSSASSSVSPEARQQILQPLSILRPKFRVRDWSANVILLRSNESFGPGRSTVLDGCSKWAMNREKRPDLDTLLTVGSRLHRRGIRKTAPRLR